MKKRKRILISGASKGLGFATAIKLSKSGHEVYCGVRDISRFQDSLTSVESGIAANLYPVFLDVSSEDSINDTVSYICDSGNPIDVLINNAAYGLFGPVDSATIPQIRALFEVNVFGMISLTQKIIPYMQAERKGHIIMVSSTAGVESSAILGLYSATKFAIEAIGASLAITLSPWNIRTSLVQPGTMATEFFRGMEVGEYYDEKSSPYRRFVENSRTFLENVMAKGQPATDAAEAILEAVNSPDPHLRYQTSEEAARSVENIQKDVSMDTWLDQQRSFTERWW